MDKIFDELKNTGMVVISDDNFKDIITLLKNWDKIPEDIKKSLRLSTPVNMPPENDSLAWKSWKVTFDFEQFEDTPIGKYINKMNEESPVVDEDQDGVDLCGEKRVWSAEKSCFVTVKNKK